MSQPTASNIHVFGIRHHGPGSARSVRMALDTLRPDIILVEGPPDAADVLPLLAHPQMQPPVALLVYVPDTPHQAVYYPFATFSPEYQALIYGLTGNIPVRFMDLPQMHQLVALPSPDEKAADDDDDEQQHPDPGEPPADEKTPADSDEPLSELVEAIPDPRSDPLGFLAQAAGYSDGERWWDHMVEQRRDSRDLFAAILEAMSAVRAEVPSQDESPEAQREAQREAFMRQTIRKAQKEGFERIAVVCGAWHAPALATLPPARDDTALLKGLPKVKVQATWVPWTYERLSYRSGYGAGVESPGWYEHLFTSTLANHSPTDVAIYWMTRVARLLRDEGLDASSAHVIEAVRLAESLAVLRDSPLPGLPEMNEASRAIFCYTSDMPLKLIHDRLVISDRLGTVPDETPMVPLQQDVQREQKRLRLPPESTWRDLDLDLRKTVDRERSHLLHRLQILDIPWGTPQRASGGKGTFHEYWRIQWYPELAIKLIEAGVWGNTVVSAATARACHEADHAPDLAALSLLVEKVLKAHLTDAIPYLTTCLQTRSALTNDVTQMMVALPNLANVLRYGDVRQTDASAVGQVVDGLLVRVFIGLPGACSSLNDDAAAEMFTRLMGVHDVVMLLQNSDHITAWRDVLRQMAEQQGMHGLIAGRCVRLLLDQREIDNEESSRRMGLALSTANDPAYAAGWIEGFLAGSGALLVHDPALLAVVDAWVTSLSSEVFNQVLPLMRRTFATFQAPERRRLGERLRASREAQPATGTRGALSELEFERAEAVLPLVGQILGLKGFVRHDGS